MVVSAETDRGLRQKIDELQLSERLSQWKKALLNTEAKVCVDRAKLCMESWKETEGEDIEIRRAKLFKKVLEGVPIALYEWDLLVCRSTQYIFGTDPHIDLSGDYIPGLMEKGAVMVGGPVVKGVLSDEEREVLKECCRFFEGKTAPDHQEKTRRSLVGTWYEDLEEAGGSDAPLRMCQGAGKASVVMFDKILAKGLRGIIQEAEANIKRFTETRQLDMNKLYFWQAVTITCEAVINYARRYAELARRMAKEEKKAARRSELEEIARVCEWVPENPARTLHEAIQSIMLVRIACRLEHTGLTDSLGRVDQYLWPYFDKDVHSGRLTLEKAADLIGSLIIWGGNSASVRPGTFQLSLQASHELSNITVGGVKKNGEDATNELTYLILHMAGLLRLPEPHITFRWHPATPRWLLLKAIETNTRSKGAIPQFQSDSHVIRYWVEQGMPVEEARDYATYGCVNPTLPSQKIEQYPTNGLAGISLPLHLDLALHNGVSPVTGKRLGPETGDPRTFKTFEELYQAFKRQHEFVVTRMLWVGALLQKVREPYLRLPFLSSIHPFCIEKGKDVACADPENYYHGITDRGIVDVADSLIAIKKLVFDEKRLTMDDLMEALDSNFAGKRGEEIRQMCLAAPKFGNDIDEVDWMVSDVGNFSASVIRYNNETRYNKGPCCPYKIIRDGAGWFLYAGKGVGALPNGRKSREPLADGSISPMRGMDRFGPTAVLRSVLKAGAGGYKDAAMTVLNQKFSNTIMQSPESREKLAVLTEVFFRGGGQHIQYNLVDAQELREAKKHPEKYRDLIVRVGGFSAYFVHLSPEVQDDIILRSEQGL